MSLEEPAVPSPELGDLIRSLRVDLGMSLRELANRIKMSSAHLSDIERGIRGTTKLEQIARALDVDPKLLLVMDARIDYDLRMWLRKNPFIIELLRRTKNLQDERKLGQEELRRVVEMAKAALPDAFQKPPEASGAHVDAPETENG